MSEPMRRLTLRVTPDNPIFTIPAGDRSRVAENWLRVGADIQKLEKLIAKLEAIVGQAELKPVHQSVAQTLEKPDVAAILAAFE
jgi:hypothetical protein